MADSVIARNISSMVESARELTLDAISQTSHTANFNANAISNLINGRVGSTAVTELSELQLVEHLNSSNEKENLIALKHIMRLCSSDTPVDVLPFFPHVVKNINSNNLTVKKLVFVYLLKYNHLEQDVSLLSINAIQKSLADRSPLIRSLAIRVICGIKIPAILPILILSIKKTLVDASPLVRSSTAIGITKVFELERTYNNTPIGEAVDDDSSNLHSLYVSLATLMSDADPKVLSSALVAFQQIFPARFELIHSRFHHICSKLAEIDEFSLAMVIPLLTDYSRLFISKPKVVIGGEAMDMPTLSQLPENYETLFHSDLSLLIESLKPLVYKQSSAVILAITRCLVSLSPPKVWEDFKLDMVLLRLLREDTTISILESIYYVASVYPKFLPDSHIPQFYLVPGEESSIANLKLLIMTELANNSNFHIIFKELKYTVESSSTSFESKALAIKGICTLCISVSDNSHVSKVLAWLLKIIDDLSTESSDQLVSEALTGVRYLIQKDLVANTDVLLKLLTKLVSFDNTDSTTKHPLARASIVWLLGEFSNQWMQSTGKPEHPALLDASLPDVLRVLVSKFAQEDPITRLQILGFAAKLFVKDLYLSKMSSSTYDFDNHVFKLFNLSLQYAKYDSSLDVRDRARLVSSLLPNIFSGSYVTTSSGLTNFEDFLSFETSPIAAEVVEQLNGKLKDLDLAALLLQVSKTSLMNATAIEASLQSVSPLFVSFMKVPDWSDPINKDKDLQNFYDSMRKRETEVKDYNKIANAISHQTTERSVSSVSSMFGFGYTDKVPAAHSTSVDTAAAAKKYKLQSLDEFFADSPSKDEESGEESEDEFGEESEEELEDDEEEEEDTDDEKHELI